MPWDVTSNFFRHEVRPKDYFRGDTFRTQPLANGIELTEAKLLPEHLGPHGGDSMVVQSVAFPKAQFTLQVAKQWIAEHPQFQAERRNRGARFDHVGALFKARR